MGFDIYQAHIFIQYKLPHRKATNMKIQRMLNSAIEATRERRFISKAPNRNLDRLDRMYLDRLVEISGPSVHSVNKIIKNWKRAYDYNMAKDEYITAMKNQFKKNRIG